MRTLAFLILIAPPTYALYQLTETYPWHLLLGTVLLINLLTFGLFRLDKRRAQAQAWRIPEKVLHLSEALGGWPASLLAQWTYRHKTKKTSYLIVFWMIVIVHQFLALNQITNWELF